MSCLSDQIDSKQKRGNNNILWVQTICRFRIEETQLSTQIYIDTTIRHPLS